MRCSHQLRGCRPRRELIQRWVLSLAKSTKPLSRLWISSLTEEAIKEGFNNLKDGSDYNRLYAAGMSRAVGDWMLGMNATRLFTLKYGTKGQVLCWSGSDPHVGHDCRPPKRN